MDERLQEYLRWLEGYLKEHGIPVEKAAPVAMAGGSNVIGKAVTRGEYSLFWGTEIIPEDIIGKHPEEQRREVVIGIFDGDAEDDIAVRITYEVNKRLGDDSVAPRYWMAWACDDLPDELMSMSVFIHPIGVHTQHEGEAREWIQELVAIFQMQAS